jgi:hypothetical protein
MSGGMQTAIVLLLVAFSFLAMATGIAAAADRKNSDELRVGGAIFALAFWVLAAWLVRGL